MDSYKEDFDTEKISLPGANEDGINITNANRLSGVDPETLERLGYLFLTITNDEEACKEHFDEIKNILIENSGSFEILINETNGIQSLFQCLRSCRTSICDYTLRTIIWIMKRSTIYYPFIIENIHEVCRLFRSPALCLVVCDFIIKVIDYDNNVCQVIVNKEDILHRCLSYFQMFESFDEAGQVSMLFLITLFYRFTENIPFCPTDFNSILNGFDSMSLGVLCQALSLYEIIVHRFQTEYQFIDRFVIMKFGDLTLKSHKKDPTGILDFYLLPVWNVFIVKAGDFIISTGLVPEILRLIYNLALKEGAPLSRIFFTLANFAYYPQIAEMIIDSGVFGDCCANYVDFPMDYKETLCFFFLNLLHAQPEMVIGMPEYSHMLGACIEIGSTGMKMPALGDLITEDLLIVCEVNRSAVEVVEQDDLHSFLEYLSENDSMAEAPVNARKLLGIIFDEEFNEE